MELHPTRGRVIARRLPARRPDQLHVIAEEKEEAAHFHVIAVGPTTSLSPGDTIIAHRYAGEDLPLVDGTDVEWVVAIHERDVMVAYAEKNPGAQSADEDWATRSAETQTHGQVAA